MSRALKYDENKLPWDLLPVEAVEGMLRILQYGARKYTVCNQCNQKVYPNPRLDGDPCRDDCPSCGSTDIATGAHNWTKGFKWTRLIAACYRHLTAVLKKEDIDPESGELHASHLMCSVAFLLSHQLRNLGKDDRFSFKNTEDCHEF